MSSQFRHKQPTRFNEPEIPQDLATKGYVDDATTHNHIYQMVCGAVDGTNSGVIEFGFWAMRVGWGNQIEARSSVMPVDTTFNNMIVKNNNNTYDADSVITHQINNADGNLTVTIPFGVTGVFSDLVNSDVMVINDESNLENDASVPTAGNSSITQISVRAVSS